MGNSDSKSSHPAPAPVPPPPKVFEKPWREMNWGNKEKMEKYLRDFQLVESQRTVRTLLVGPIAAGKSSLINSINNVFQGRITSSAFVSGELTGKSFTLEYRTHYIRNGDSWLPFVFNDTMGLEAAEAAGAPTDELIKALLGQLMEGHNFNPAAKVSPTDRVKNPDKTKQIFCLAFVLPADNVNRIDEKIFEKLRRLREEATQLRIPQVLLLTRVDKSCELVHGDLRKIYLSKKIKEQMETCHVRLGIPMLHIFPVKNYHEETDTQNDMDVLILKALTQIVQLSNDKLDLQNLENSQ